MSDVDHAESRSANPAGSSVLVRLDHIARSYGRRRVFDDLSMDLGLGVTAILGPNGAGKSTLLECIATACPPAAGVISMFGAAVESERSARVARRRIGYMPQRFGYLRGMTMTETVRYAAWAREVPEPLGPQVLEALESVGLAAEAGRKMRVLSGGTVQRVGLACALVGTPGLLVLDEPTVGLDPAQRILFREAVRRHSGSASVVLSTHNVDDVAAVADRVVVFDSGRVMFDGSVDDLASADRGGPGITALERGYMTMVGGQS